MAHIIAQPTCEVLTSGYSYHSREYRIEVKEGLQKYLIRLQTEGTADLLVKGKVQRMMPGDLLLVHPNDPYFLRAGSTMPVSPSHGRSGSGDYYIFLSGPFVEKWWRLHHPNPHYHVSLDGEVCQLMKQIARAQYREGTRARDIQDYLAKALLLTIESMMMEQNRNHQQSYVAYQMKHYIEKNIADSFQIQDVAAEAKLSVSRAVHLFKEVFQTSMMQYALELRLDMAKERIRYTPMNLEHIAESCGFNSYTYFHRVFKRKFGVSPGLYRQKP
ncbi:helix-turn-helix transcriptional regulator [Marinicrinis sediminis]|uniref:AraC family transcriptional regulator n=1 Tax=Marinicrinis sediminis TaxID=1652465 RepID=A0ABW5R5U1_9BACL